MVISYPLVRRLRSEVIPAGSKIGNATSVTEISMRNSQAEVIAQSLSNLHKSFEH